MGARVYVAGARVHVRSYWWEPESMLGVMGGARVYAAGARVYVRSYGWSVEPESTLQEPESMLVL